MKGAQHVKMFRPFLMHLDWFSFFNICSIIIQIFSQFYFLFILLLFILFLFEIEHLKLYVLLYFILIFYIIVINLVGNEGWLAYHGS